MLNYRTVFFLILMIWNQFGNDSMSDHKGQDARTQAVNLIGSVEEEQAYLTELEALDRVREKYASNFVKVYRDDLSYYYQLDIADYYLVSEGTEGDRYYLIHLYEFVVDEEESGIGHTVTYGWYAVDRRTGEIEERME